MSVWESVETLAAYVYSDTHRQVLRRRRSGSRGWPKRTPRLWWIPRGHVPTTDDAEERVLHLREFGPTPAVFTLRGALPATGRRRRQAGPEPGGMDVPRLIREWFLAPAGPPPATVG